MAISRNNITVVMTVVIRARSANTGNYYRIRTLKRAPTSMKRLPLGARVSVRLCLCVCLCLCDNDTSITHLTLNNTNDNKSRPDRSPVKTPVAAAASTRYFMFRWNATRSGDLPRCV